ERTRPREGYRADGNRRRVAFLTLFAHGGDAAGLHRCPVNLARQRETNSGLPRSDILDEVARLVGVPNPIETTVRTGLGVPAFQSDRINLTVDRIDPAAHEPRFEIERQANREPVWKRRHVLHHDVEHRTLSIRRV